MSGIAADRAHERARQHTDDGERLIVLPPTSLSDMVAFVNERVAAGRWVTGGLGLIRVKSVYEQIAPRERRADEKTWPAFAERRLTFGGFAGAEELLGRFDPARRCGMIRCGGCGAVGKAPCQCGVRCLPAEPGDPAAVPRAKPDKRELSAREKAAAAIAADPEKSDRAIAAELGIGHATVSRARGPRVSPPVSPERTTP